MNTSTSSNTAAQLAKDKTLENIVRESEDSAIIETGLSGAWPYVIGGILVIGLCVCLWHFVISKSPSGQDCIKSSNAGAAVAQSSGTYATSFGNSGKSF